MLDVKNLSIGYEGKPVAEDINFSVKEGDFLCIVGENGAGKSTLVKTLLRLTKPLSGEIVFKEEGIGYLPQQTVVQRDFPASVWEIALSGNISKLGARPFYRAEEKKRAEDNLKRMGIWNLRKECYRNLSGGQQQRVLLARALCASEKLLVLDEPVSGLDPKVTAEFYELTKELNKSGITIIMVSHDIKAIMEFSDHILHIGRDNVFFGTTEEYLKSSIAKEIGLNSGEEG
ncbi:MAG: metal ABC transporter ATP-binding protein [Lachnospiraceae bacterium]|nr:metal ABC transporter ATP-binding protein [Lachnospiraceae bacterium]MBO7601057.1 metal ABC transporter ATP-binding protein [Lachnospiraceae bacterium]